VLASGREWCERAREAVRKGGANVLAGDTKLESRKMLARLGRADELFVMLGVDLSDPSAIIDGHVVELDELGKWVGDTYHDLKAARELDGAIPPATATDQPAYPLSAFPKPLRARLRAAAQPGRKTMRVNRRKGSSGEWLYSVADARRLYPQEMTDCNIPLS
jgi:hypothetical protein